MSGDEFLDGGSRLDEAKVFAKLLEEAGADRIDVSAGVYESAERTVPPMAMERGCNIYLAGEIKLNLNFLVIGVGRIKTLDEAETILQTKTTDLVAMGRGGAYRRSGTSRKSADRRQHPSVYRSQSRVYWSACITASQSLVW